MKTLVVKMKGMQPILVDCRTDQIESVKTVAENRRRAIVANVEPSAIFRFSAENPAVRILSASNFLMLYR